MNYPIRSLPPPRRSRSRRLRMLLHRIYRIITLRWLTQRHNRIIIKKRRTPFHVSRGKYKVKVPNTQRTHSRLKFFFSTTRQVAATQVLNYDVADDLSQLLETNGAVIGNIRVKVGKRRRVRDKLAIDRRYFKHLFHGIFGVKRVYNTI